MDILVYDKEIRRCERTGRLEGHVHHTNHTEHSQTRTTTMSLKAIVEKIGASAKNAKTIGKSCIHAILKRLGRYPEEEDENVTPEEFLRPPELGERFCIDTGTCFIGDKIFRTILGRPGTALS